MKTIERRLAAIKDALRPATVYDWRGDLSDRLNRIARRPIDLEHASPAELVAHGYYQEAKVLYVQRGGDVGRFERLIAWRQHEAA